MLSEIIYTISDMYKLVWHIAGAICLVLVARAIMKFGD